MPENGDAAESVAPSTATRRAVIAGAAGGLAALGTRAFTGTASAQTTEVPPHAPTHADGGSDSLSNYYAGLDTYNRYTKDQVVEAALGIGTDPFFPLQVVRADPGIAAQIKSAGQALALHQTTDWQGDVVDTANIFHRSSGDGLFVAHLGGLPPGYTGPRGGNAGLNALIPYHLDTAADDYSGTVVNDRRGMSALRIATQAPNEGVIGIAIRHQGQDAAISITNQDPAHPRGHGFGILLDNHSDRAGIAVQVRGQSPAAPAFRVMDFAGFNPTFPSIGTQAGQVHLIPSTGVNDSTLGITFGGILGGGSAHSGAHAGIYVQSSGAYGTKMYLATTSDFSKGSQARVVVDHFGRMGIKQLQPRAMLHIEPSGPTDRLLSLKMAPGQSAYPFEVRDHGDVVVALINTGGSGTFGAQAAGPGRLNTYSALPGIVAFTAQSAAGQSADLIQLKDSTGAITSRWDKTGTWMTRRTVAPADADLANSELAMWLDDTPNATKVMFKAKDRTGRVRTGNMKLV